MLEFALVSGTVAAAVFVGGTLVYRNLSNRKEACSCGSQGSCSKRDCCQSHDSPSQRGADHYHG